MYLPFQYSDFVIIFTTLKSITKLLFTLMKQISGSNLIFYFKRFLSSEVLQRMNLILIHIDENLIKLQRNTLLQWTYLKLLFK